LSAACPVPRWGVELCAPLSLAALALLGLNDHLGKALFQNDVTGKLSDVAGCFFFPLYISALLGLLWRRHPRARLALSSAAAAMLFTAIEMSDVAGRALSAAMPFLGAPMGVTGVALTRDPTDLLTLVMVPCAYVYGLRRMQAAAAPRAQRVLGRVLVLGAGTLLLGATSAVHLDCDHYSAPLAFRVEGDCGPPGVIVVDNDGFSHGLTVSNVDPLGGAAMGRYKGTHCPVQLARGDWSLDIRACGARPEGSADAGRPFTEATSCTGPIVRTCDVGLQGDELWATCTGCRAKLTVVP